MDSLKTKLRMLKQMDLKPNYSALSREYSMDRHTIKKIYEGLDSPPKERKPRASELDQHREEIAALLSQQCVSLRSAYWYLCSERELGCTYSNFKHYVRSRDLRAPKSEPEPHPLYETGAGEFVQCDWVESLSMRLKGGETVEFNLFSATLSYSRLHYFEFTERKDEAAFKRCFCHYLEWLGGKPKTMMTDNMSALVSVQPGGKKTLHASAKQFFDDIGVKCWLCKARTPQTKGKDETSNKYAKWLAAYDGRLETMEQLVKLISKLTNDVNKEPNSTTMVPPLIMISKEKEHLSPLPAKELLESYKKWSREFVVPATMLISYLGSRYSVPKDYITKTVTVEDDGKTVYIYYKDLLIAKHQLAEIPGSVRYDEKHLEGALAAKNLDQGEIDKYMEATLSGFREMEEARRDV